MKARRSPAVRAVRAAFAAAQRTAYGVLFRTEVSGAHHAPARGGFLIAANHESHLDMGLIKHALGGREIFSLAAKDYFFENPLQRLFFTHFTNLLPFDRRARLKESLAIAAQVLAAEEPLLLFPEGTRTRDGRMGSFKPSLGYLALNNDADVLPVHIDGAFEALPKGSLLPRARTLRVRVGPLVRCRALHSLTKGMANNEAYRAATFFVEASVRALGGEAAGDLRAIPDVVA